MDIENTKLFILKTDLPVNAAGLIDVKYPWCAPKLRFRWLRGILRHCNVYYKWILWLLYKIPLKNIRTASVVICFDERSDFFMCRLFSRCFSNKRLIMYSWNIFKEEEVFRFRQFGWELWSFDRGDCRKYDMRFNKPFIAAALMKQDNQIVPIKQDVFFIGTDKGRRERILRIESILNGFGISTKIIIADPKLKKRNVTPQSMYAPPMAYNEILYEVQQSKAILDVHMEGEEGISQRELEALFLGKKLITTRKEVENRDFYDPRNIYIMDFTHSHDDIVRFLDTPMAEIPEEIVQSYSFDEWVKRFFQ